MNKEYLEAIERVKNNLEHHYPENIRDFNILKQALLKAQEQEKVLSIIKEKPQAELSLIQLGRIKTYEEYLNYTGEWELDLYGDMVYTEEEYDLLKRWLG